MLIHIDLQYQLKDSSLVASDIQCLITDKGIYTFIRADAPFHCTLPWYIFEMSCLWIWFEVRARNSPHKINKFPYGNHWLLRSGLRKAIRGKPLDFRQVPI